MTDRGSTFFLTILIKKLIKIKNSKNVNHLRTPQPVTLLNSPCKT